MARFFTKLTLNQRLGLVGLTLGALATFAEVAPARTKVVLSGDGGIHAAQGFMVLKGKGHTCGGAPRAGTGGALATPRLPELPKLEAGEVATAPGGAAPTRRKKKEGC